MVNPRGVAAFDALPSHIAILDRAGSIVYVNAAWRQFAGDNRSPDLQGFCGANYLDVCWRAAEAGDTLAGEALNGISKVISGEAQRYRQRYPCHGGGVERWFMMTVTRARHGRDIVISHDDITSLVRAEREREAAEKKLESGLRAGQPRSEKDDRKRSVFVANVGHELRTPLNAILGFSEIIRDQLFGADLKRYSGYADDIYKSGSHLLEVIQGILELAKIEAGRYELEETSVRLDKHLGECVKAVRAQAESRGVELSAATACSGVRLVADETVLREIIINLLSNAVKFTQKGGKVWLSAAQKSNGRLAVAIRDTGKGMTSEEIQLAMEPFRQAGNEAEGAGLGLPLALRLTELHGGSLEIESTPGLGTTVSVEFPAWRIRASGNRRISQGTNSPELSSAEP